MNDRTIKILEARQSGLSLMEIGTCFSITGERVRQIISKVKTKDCECNNRILIEYDNSRFCINCFHDIKIPIVLIRGWKEKRVPVHAFKLFKDYEPNGRERTRMLVRIRDSFTCQDCYSVRTFEESREHGKRMFDVHHLNGLCGKKSRSYDRVSEIDGLITLCHKCHFNRPEHKTKRKAVDSFNRLINS